MTFDFDRWCDWLNAQTQVLHGEGLEAEFAITEKYGRKMSLQIRGQKAISSFRNWENGALVDYEIIRLDDSSLVANEAMIKVSDDNFQTVFDKFVKIYKSVL